MADYYNWRIQKFTYAGAFVAAWGSPGSGESQFNGPERCAVNAEGASTSST